MGGVESSEYSSSNQAEMSLKTKATRSVPRCRYIEFILTVHGFDFHVFGNVDPNGLRFSRVHANHG
jgi:hypothetical protein